MSMERFITLGELPAEQCADFQRCFDIRFLRRVGFQALPGSNCEHRVLIPGSWPKNQIERMKWFFTGWQDSRKRSSFAMATQTQGVTG